MTLSIRWKVTLATLFALACGFIIAGILATRSLEEQELAQSSQSLDITTKLIAFDVLPLLTASPSLPSTAQLQVIVRDLSQRSLARVTLLDAAGTVLADSAVADRDLSAVENHLTRPEIKQAVATGSGTDVRASHTTGERTLYRAIRLGKPAQTIPPMYLRLGLPMTRLDEELASLKRTLILAFVSAFLIVVALSIWLAGSLTKPLLDMAVTARQLAAGNHTVHIRTSSRDEVGLLADTLNHMTDELQSKIDALSEDRSQLQAMLTSMVEGVMVLDYRGHVLQVNPALERMFGVTRTEARGRQFSEVFRHQELTALVSNVLVERSGREGEILLDQSGRCLHIEASVAGGQKENEACAVLVFHDITELRKLENIRRDFVANVSHELRTPLTSIKGYVEALLDGGKDDPETSVRFLDIILKQSDRLNLILEDLLQLSKIESGQVRFKREPLHIGSVIERTLAMIKPLADKKHHRLNSHIASDLPLISGDEERLVQVLANLLDNAIKYTPEGGQITVAARRVPSGRHTADSQQDGIELTVADSGIGIPQKDRPRVFERFYRVDKARSRELGGTGLGLGMIKERGERRA
ncbi:histidine kinase dimerization/phospho-acceptor domain-containing protein, partial [Petrachloros mirabilis]